MWPWARGYVWHQCQLWPQHTLVCVNRWKCVYVCLCQSWDSACGSFGSAMGRLAWHRCVWLREWVFLYRCEYMLVKCTYTRMYHGVHAGVSSTLTTVALWGTPTSVPLTDWSPHPGLLNDDAAHLAGSELWLSLELCLASLCCWCFGSSSNKTPLDHQLPAQLPGLPSEAWVRFWPIRFHSTLGKKMPADPLSQGMGWGNPQTQSDGQGLLLWHSRRAQFCHRPMLGQLKCARAAG